MLRGGFGAIRSYYTDPAMLESIVSGNDVDRELGLLARDASRMLRGTTAIGGDVNEAGLDAERLRRSIELERRTSPRGRDQSGPPAPGP